MFLNEIEMKSYLAINEYDINESYFRAMINISSMHNPAMLLQYLGIFHDLNAIATERVERRLELNSLDNAVSCNQWCSSYIISSSPIDNRANI